MNNQNINVIISNITTQLAATINSLQKQYSLPSCLMDGIISSILAEMRKTELMELTIAHSQESQEHESESDKESAATD